MGACISIHSMQHAACASLCNVWAMQRSCLQLHDLPSDSSMSLQMLLLLPLASSSLSGWRLPKQLLGGSSLYAAAGGARQ
jgi:hypothetical protein